MEIHDKTWVYMRELINDLEHPESTAVMRTMMHEVV